jgi:WS/DGAT/MGAT family acyltransferase
MSLPDAERRMTDAEALMWSLDADPALRSSFVSVTFLDRTPDFGRFRRRVEQAIGDNPSLRNRVAPAALDLLTPRWELDPGFDLDFHVRRTALPAPGTRQQVLDLAALWAQDPFDRTRPLWQFTIVEGLANDEAALIAKMHHVLSDGVGAVRMSAAFLDLTPDPADGEPATLGRPREADPAVPTEMAGGLTGLLSGAGTLVGDNLGRARRVAAGVFDTVRQPQQLPRQALQTLSLGRSLARQLAVIEPARSPLWSGRQSYVHHFEARSIELDEVKATAKALGGTVNDVFVAAVAGAAGAYHRARGEHLDELRMSMPVSTRHDHNAGGNAWAPTRVLVPVTADPRRRFDVVHARLESTKHEASLGLADVFAGVVRTLPAPLLIRLARQQVGTVDFACSNVRGAPFDLWIGGARVLANYPMGPTAGTAFNATVLSYRDRLDLGLNTDIGAVDGAAELGDLIVDAFGELASVRT